MRWLDKLLMLVPALAPLAIGCDAFLTVSPTLFLVLGFLSLVSIYLPEKTHFWIIPLIYVPALFSLYTLVANKQPGPLIELASGYLISIPFLTTVGTLRASTPRSAISSYVSALTSATLLWMLAHHSTYGRPEIFVAMINMLVGRESWESPNLPQTYAVLTAISTLALIVNLGRPHGLTSSREFSRPLIYSLTAASITTALLVLYSVVFTDSTPLALLVTAALTFLVVGYSGASARWKD